MRREASLSRLLTEPPSEAHPVAFGREGTRTAVDLRSDVASLASRLEPLAGRRVLVHCQDAYAFAVALLGVAQVRACAVLPPSRQPGALRALAGGVAAALLDGVDAPESVGGRPCWHPLRVPRAARPLSPLDREAPVAEIFTSGTTGPGTSVTKAVRHLEDEVSVLEARFGRLLGPGARVLATMAPQHLYGLLFRVVWPLAAGRSFLRTSVLHPEELVPHFAAHEGFSLAATPVALRHLVEKDELSLFGPVCRAVFSSGGPLPAAVAHGIARAAGAPPFEVYGSTETGGVAVRQQWRGGETWRPLPGVEVAEQPDGRLEVCSPFVSSGDRAPDGRERCLLGDRIRMAADGSFALLGRADRVVKVGEKRLSLPEMEERLRAHPAVADVALVPLDPVAETRVGAAVTVTAVGNEVLEAGGRRALAKVLSEHLAADFDRVLLPRAWRVVEALPRDLQGKVPAEGLRALFEPDVPPRGPEVRGARRAARELSLELRVPEDLAFLEGHYPGQPLVAGVVQVHFAMSALEELLGAPPRLARLEALKFREPLLPGQEVRLFVRVADDGARFEFALFDLSRPERAFSSGRGALRPA